jgi:hypothetical protein
MHIFLKCWIFSWAMSNIRANDEYRSEVGATNRPENIVIRYVNFVSLFRLFVCTYLNLKVVDVFSFHLQIFHWFIALRSRRYFQGHSPWENPTLLTYFFWCLNPLVLVHFTSLPFTLFFSLSPFATTQKNRFSINFPNLRCFQPSRWLVWMNLNRQKSFGNWFGPARLECQKSEVSPTAVDNSCNITTGVLAVLPIGRSLHK